MHQNTIYTGDNLFVLNGMAEESVDLIYLDPPFNSKRMYHAPTGSKAEGASFKDIWKWEDVDGHCVNNLIKEHALALKFILNIGDMHSKAMMSYITYMAQRLIQMERILKKTGSIYLHCDPTASHYLKMLMDVIFGKENFLNEIVWQRTSAHSNAGRCGSVHDIIFLYKKGDECLWNGGKQQYNEHYIKTHYTMKDERGIFRAGDLTAPSYSASRDYAWKGVKVGGGRSWAYSKEKMEELDQQGLIYYTSKGKPSFKRYLDRSKGTPLQDIWCDIPPVNSQAHERVGYPTQKPLALLNRIIKASSNEGDIVLDPFCGCATTCVSAHHLKRKWIGIDVSPKAVELIETRIGDQQKTFIQQEKITEKVLFKDFVATESVPDARSNVRRMPPQKAKTELYGLCKGFCRCGTHFEFRHLTVDHIIPRAKGGGDYFENYELLCGDCNSTKGARPLEYLDNYIRNLRQAEKSVKY